MKVKQNRHQVMGGQPVILTPLTPVLEACCDCGLVHLVSYSVKRIKGKQYIQRVCYRDDWETNIVRNKRNSKNKLNKAIVKEEK